MAEADAQALHGLDQLLVARRAVEEPPQLLLLRRRGGVHLQHLRASRALADVVAERFQRLAIGRGVGQQVGALAHHRGAERFERAQHAHARRRILGGQLRDGDEPAVHGRWHLILCGL